MLSTTPGVRPNETDLTRATTRRRFEIRSMRRKGPSMLDLTLPSRPWFTGPLHSGPAWLSSATMTRGAGEEKTPANSESC